MAEDNNSVGQLAFLRMLQKELGGPAAEDLSSANPAEFQKVVSDAAEKNPMIKANVTPYTPEEYEKFKTFLSADKNSGYAVKPASMTQAGKDELISVFSKNKGRGKDILNHAVDVGKAQQLDAFDINNKLPSLYGKEFKETSRMKFNPQYAPEGWDYDKLGSPDVVGMDLDKSSKNLMNRDLRKLKRGSLKYGLPALAIGSALTADTADEGLMNLIVPGGVETLGNENDAKEFLNEAKIKEARKEFIDQYPDAEKAFNTPAEVHPRDLINSRRAALDKLRR
jgi:hypothetical protein